MEQLLGKNWPTTLGGLILGLGLALETTFPPEIAWIAKSMAAVGGVILGVAAKAFNVHSTQQEVKKSTIETAIKEADDALLK